MTTTTERPEFSAAEALEWSEDGAPVIISRMRAAQLIREHGARIWDMDEEVPVASEYDAAVILRWLGY